MPKKATDSISTWQIIVAVMTVVVSVAVLAVQWQTSIDQMIVLEQKMAELSIRHEQDNDSLIAQNRERRDAVANLESRVAVLEERTNE